MVGCLANAEVLGVVRDAAGGAVPFASLRLLNLATGLTASTSSQTDGSYLFAALPPGEYRLEVEKFGFKPLRRDGVVLRVGARLVLDLELALGDALQVVEVSGAVPLLQASRGAVSIVLEQRKVVTLPLDGRNFVPLIALSPGVNLPPGSVLPRINGSRPRVSEYLYDGISVLQPEPGQVAFYPIVDAIDEFRVETNSYSAEYGRSNGGIIIVSQKSGANQLRGTLFEFFRNEKLNARNLFAGSGAKPNFRRNQYGFVLGGPVRKNSTFFFVDWQGNRLNTGVVRTSTVPTAAERQGMFAVPVFDPASTRRTESGYLRDPFPGNTIPRSRFDPAALRLLERYPLPNSPGTANNYRRVGNDNTAADQFDVRTDRYFGTRHRAFVRYSFLRDRSVPTTPLPEGSGQIAAGVIGDTLTRADSVAAEHNWTATPEIVNQLRLGLTGRRFERSALRTGATSPIPNVPVSSFGDVLPTFDVVGYQQIGPPSNGNARFTTSVLQLADTLSFVRGRHGIKVGTDIRRQSLDVLQPASPAGNFQFTGIFTAGLQPSGSVIANTGSSLASFLLGEVTRFSMDAQPETLKPRATVAEFFAQDDVRATRRLSVNLGVRYTLNFPSTVVNDRGAVFNLDTQRLDFLGVNGYPRSARNLEKTNFAPRAGLAYKLGETVVVRAGYGLTWIEQAGITTPFTTPLFPFIQTLTEQALDNIQPAFPLSWGPSVRLTAPGPDSGLGQGVFAVQRDNGSGYAQQWNLTFQKTFGDNWSVETGYLGSKLTRLGVPDVNINQLRVEQLAAGPQVLRQAVELRPYPRFTTVALCRNNVGHSTYHSLQARLEKRLSRALSFTAAYTYSKLIDDAGAVFDSAILTGPAANFQAADSHNRRLEKDVSTGNMPHIVSSGFVWDLPRGWRFAGIARSQSGSPVPVTQATNLNAFAGFGIQRPNRVGRPGLPADQRSVRRWFDTGAFTQAPQLTIGNSSRNPVVGPGYRTLDVMIGKMFDIAEQVRIELRAEAFNATNTPPLGNPNGSFGSPAFGSITTALDPRVFELVLKLHF
jgi:hypothetical protein